MLKPLALQLYSVREAAQQDYEAMIRKVAKIGFMGIEPAGFPGIEPRKASSLFNELGLTVTSIHAPLPLGDRKNEILDLMALLKCPYLIVPYLPPEDFKDRDSINKISEKLNEGNVIAKENGFRLGYHNHWWEAEIKIDGVPAYKILVENLDKDIIFQVDTYWMKTGGLDVVEVIRELGQRVQLLHVKDGPAVKDEPMTAVGDGVMDWEAIISASQEHTDWLIVEMDRCATDMFEAVEKSYDYLIHNGLAYGKR